MAELGSQGGALHLDGWRGRDHARHGWLLSVSNGPFGELAIFSACDGQHWGKWSLRVWTAATGFTGVFQAVPSHIALS